MIAPDRVRLKEEHVAHADVMGSIMVPAPIGPPETSLGVVKNPGGLRKGRERQLGGGAALLLVLRDDEEEEAAWRAHRLRRRR